MLQRDCVATVSSITNAFTISHLVSKMQGVLYYKKTRSLSLFITMKKLTPIQFILLSILAIAVIILGVFAITQYNNTPPAIDNNNNQLTISHESGYYADSILFQVTGDNITQIYYTLDGSDPSPDNPAAKIYSEGIYIPSENTETIYTIRLLACFHNGITSDIINRTFVTGDNIMERYGIPVLLLSVDDVTFFDEEGGIMIGDNKFLRGRESEKEVFMTLFDENGEQLLSQSCGFRIYGDFSRHNDQPSFRLYARSEYDLENDFEYTLFTNLFTEENTLIPETKRIIARSSGNDNGFAYIRSELATRLSLNAGYPDTLSANPVAVYFNNTYYGSYWFVPNFDENYFRQTYGDYEGTMYLLEGTVYQMTPDENETDKTLISLMEEYNEKLAFFSTADLTLEENWSELNNYMDVENFLQYMAIHNYTDNFDILKNNYKIYRYVAPEGGSYTEDSVFDGRYRFLLYDLDYAFGFNGEDNTLSTSERINNPDEKNLFFVNLMKREDCRAYYIRYTLSLQNYYFSDEYAGPILDEMHTSREIALSYAFQTTNLLDDNNYAEDASYEDGLQREINRIHDFLINRSEYVTQDLSGIWGPFTTYNLNLINRNAANITLDYANFNETEFSGLYYKEVPLSISAKAKPGYRFDYWVINGEIHTDATIEIISSMITDDSLYLECITSPDPDAEICITALKTNIGNDYIELTNLSATDRYLNHYYLTDDDTKRNKSSLPSIKLKAGERITVYCKSYTGLESLGQPYVNFNLAAGETLSLYHGDEVLQSITIPDLGTKEGVYRMNMENGIFYEVIPE